METFARDSVNRYGTIAIETQRPTEFIDVTDAVMAIVAEAALDTGLVNIQSLHTTTAVVVNEHEPLLLNDLGAVLHRLVPTDAAYEHDDSALRTVNCVPGERANGHSHCRALLMPPSVCLNVGGGRLQLGQWQRVFLVELDGPRRRELSVLLLGVVACRAGR